MASSSPGLIGGERVGRSHGPADAVLIAVGTGALLLLGRPLLGGAHGTPAFLFLGYAGLLAVSLIPRMARESAPALPQAFVALVGIAVVLVVARAAGPSVPVVVSALAIPLNLAAAVAEEAFFRRLVYGGLTRWGPVVAVAASALAFALVHIPIYGPAVFWVDLGAGLFLGWQRWASGGWGAAAATHAAANLLVVVR